MNYVFVIIGFLLVSLVYVYNELKRGQVAVESAKSGMDVALKRRFDLIPNLVEAVKGYATHEKAVFESVASMRHGDNTAQENYDKSGATINRLLALSESYPELRANENFVHLQRALMDVEEHIQASRRIYNRNVALLKNKAMTFPGNIVNKIANVKIADYFEIADDERGAVSIDLKSSC